jgi:hypothetical protein
MMSKKSYLSAAGAAFLLLSLGACGGADVGSVTPDAPTVSSTAPATGATNVLALAAVSVTFSEAMDPATLDATNFKLTSGAAATPVAGTVTWSGSTVVFAHTAPLAVDTTYTATVSTGVRNMAGTALATRHSWSFSTGSAVVPPVAPTVVSSVPLDRATDVALNGSVRATFSQAMDPATLTSTTFKVTYGTPAIAAAGIVTYASSKAVFSPSANLLPNTLYTATLTTGAANLVGTSLVADHSWSFTTGSAVVPGLPVNLATSGGFVILAKSGISTVSPSVITGNIAVSPLAATYITGFSLIADGTNVFSTSSQVTGKVYAADYAPPTPDNLTTAVLDMQLAFTDAAGRAPDFTELGAGNIGGMTLPSGVYKWGTSLLIPTDVTLTGSATDVWIFQISGDLTMSSAVRVHLAGGALAKNIFWQVAGLVDLGTTAHAEGVILCKTAIILRTGASINGRMLAQTAVTIASSTIVKPAP